MIINANNVEKISIDSDICIIGSGPAACSFIEKFLDSEFSITIIESGNFSFDKNVNMLNEGQSKVFGNFPHENYMLKSARVRMIGGTSNVWAGWSGPLLDEDFKKKDWIPNSGWQINYEDLKDYYFEAQKILGLSEFIYDEKLFNYYPEELKLSKLDNLDHSFWQFSDPPLNFKKKYKNKFKKSKNINLYYNCTATKFTKEIEKKIKNIETFNEKKEKILFNAKFFVLACGGIENASLLLNSKTNISELEKNQNIGNYFFEHPHITLAKGKTNDRNFLETYKKQKLKNLGNIQSLAGFSVKEITRKKNQLLNCITVLSDHNLLDVESAIIIRHNLALGGQIIKTNKLINIFLKNLPKLLKNLNLILNNFVFKSKTFHLICRLEQQPVYENKVYLSKAKNKYDNYLPNISWELSDLDYKTLRDNYNVIKKIFDDNKIAEIEPSNFIKLLDKNKKKDVFAVGHHMGTTRMSENSYTGVVNKDLKVHNLDNLYIAGSSVFPTGGFINPTMTIIALSLKLSNHINKMLKI
jgi:hypothetical protein